MESPPPPSLPLPPPPPPEIVRTPFFPRNAGYALQDTSPVTVTNDNTDDSSASLSISPSILVISAIIAFVILVSASIKLLLRCKSAPLGVGPSSSSSASAGVFPLPLSSNRRTSSASFSSTSTVETASDHTLSDEKKAALIDSLPIFSLSSSLATVPKSSPDCAVCLNPFLPQDELRLLPACRHAFHSSCVDIWLRSTPSCPLCRASITLPAPPILPAATAAPPPAGVRESSRSGSFRIEIGSVSWRRSSVDVETGNRHPNPGRVPPPSVPLRTYSIGSEMEYMIDEEMEVEAVLARIPRRAEKEEEKRPETEGPAVAAAPAAPGEEVAEAAGGGGGVGRSGSWLREYVDRLASSTSSSFSSFRLSGRWSHRYDDGGVRTGARPPWDLEGSGGGEAEDGAIYGFYRWVVGAY